MSRYRLDTNVVSEIIRNGEGSMVPDSALLIRTWSGRADRCRSRAPLSLDAGPPHDVPNPLLRR